MNRSLPPAVRRLVLACALLAATLVALLPDTPAVRAASGAPAAVLAQSTAKSAQDAARDAADAARQAAAEAAGQAKAAAAQDDDEERPRHHGMSLKIEGLDRQYDSFDQFLDRDPALAAMVLGIVFIVFLVPILIIALIIWYKVRKNRMQNETLLKLAERGIVPPADAVRAVGSGRIDTVVNAATAAMPLAEQARLINKRAAWSDLRKGVIMGTIGLALTLYAIIEEASASWIGLVLLFVGIGYVVLWYFEERQATALGAAPTARGPADSGP